MDIMAAHALLPFPPPIIGIGIEIMMASETVNFLSMGLVLKHYGRPLMSSEFLMSKKHYRILGKSSRYKSEAYQKNRKEPCKFHQSSF